MTPCTPHDRTTRTATPLARATDGIDAVRGPRRPAVLMVDAHPTILWGLRRLVDSSPGTATVQDCADSLEQALLRAYSRPDVIVIDIDVGGHSALEVFTELRVRSEAALVVYTREDDDRLLRDARLLGASAIVAKGSPGARLLEAIGGVATASGARARAHDGTAPRPAVPVDPARLPALAPTERAALRALAAHRASGGALPLLLDQVPSVAALKSLYTKLGARDRGELAALLDALEAGIA